MIRVGTAGLLGLLITTSASSPSGQDAVVAADIDSFVQQVMAAGLTPGLAVSVVRGSDLIYAKGFGFADRETRREVTPDTQFYIASTTKSFTALAAAILADRGQIDLNRSLASYVPGIRLQLPLSADQISLRALLSMTHGIEPIGPVDFRTAYTGEFTNDLLLELLQVHPAAATGNAFRYSNLGYNVFSLVLDAQFREGWKEVLQREVFAPLGMTSTTAWMSRADPARLAQPYELRNNRPEREPYAKADENMHAAGGHLSTVIDLARYLEAHLNEGRLDGKQVVASTAIRATHQKQADQDRMFGPYHRDGWALGWDMGTYDGDRIVERFGGFRGFHSHLSFMPDRRIGVAVLVNGGAAGSLVADVVATYIYDRALEKPRADERVTQLSGDIERIRGLLAKDAATRAARPQTTPLPLSAYAGTYISPALGTMVWTLENGRLKVRSGLAVGDVEVYDGAKFQLRVTLLGGGSVVTFNVPQNGDHPTSLTFLNHTFTRVELPRVPPA